METICSDSLPQNLPISMNKEIILGKVVEEINQSQHVLTHSDKNLAMQNSNSEINGHPFCMEEAHTLDSFEAQPIQNQTRPSPHKKTVPTSDPLIQPSQTFLHSTYTHSVTNPTNLILNPTTQNITPTSQSLATSPIPAQNTHNTSNS